MYSTKNSHPASSPGPRHVTRPPGYPSELPSPSKRSRMGSTPSSSSSRSLPSTPVRDRSNSDFYQTRFESTRRLKDAWAQLAQRYARPLDEDDIIDLREEKLLKDRGVVRNIATQINFGDISFPDELGNDASSDVGGVHSEDEDELDEIDALSNGPHVKNKLEAQLRRVKPIRDLDPEDENDLRDFLEAEKRLREEDPRRVEEGVGTENCHLADELVETPPDELGNDASSDGGGVHSADEDELDVIEAVSHGARVKKLEAQLRRVKPIRELDPEDESDLRDFLEAEKRMRGEDSRRVTEEVGTEDRYLADEWVEISSDGDTEGANADCESDDDELGGWEHDESTAIYEVRTPGLDEHEIVEIFDTDEHEIIEIFDTPPTSPPPSSPLPMSEPPDIGSDEI